MHTIVTTSQEDYGVIGVDVGGTKISAALICSSGEIIQCQTIPTDIRSAEVILAQIESLISHILRTSSESLEVKGIGIGLPGAIDNELGIALYASNLPWNNTPIVGCLQAKFDLPVYIHNDASAAALGEKWFGQGQFYNNFVYLSIGTGIGSGIIINKQLIQANRGLSSEVGHMIIIPGGPICPCGSRGCLEALASGSAIAKRMRVLTNQADLNASATDVINAAQKGDIYAVQVLEETAQNLAIAVVNIWRLLAPERIILGGGVMQAGQALLLPIQCFIKEITSGRSLPSDFICLSDLMGNSGVLGAGSLVLEKEKGGSHSQPVKVKANNSSCIGGHR